MKLGGQGAHSRLGMGTPKKVAAGLLGGCKAVQLVLTWFKNGQIGGGKHYHLGSKFGICVEQP